MSEGGEGGGRRVVEAKGGGRGGGRSLRGGQRDRWTGEYSAADQEAERNCRC